MVVQLRAFWASLGKGWRATLGVGLLAFLTHGAWMDAIELEWNRSLGACTKGAVEELRHVQLDDAQQWRTLFFHRERWTECINKKWSPDKAVLRVPYFGPPAPPPANPQSPTTDALPQANSATPQIPPCAQALTQAPWILEDDPQRPWVTLDREQWLCALNRPSLPRTAVALALGSHDDVLRDAAQAHPKSATAAELLELGTREERAHVFGIGAKLLGSFEEAFLREACCGAHEAVLKDRLYLSSNGSGATVLFSGSAVELKRIGPGRQRADGGWDTPMGHGVLTGTLYRRTEAITSNEPGEDYEIGAGRVEHLLLKVRWHDLSDSIAGDVETGD